MFKLLLFVALIFASNGLSDHQERISSLNKAKEYQELHSKAVNNCSFAQYKQCNSSYGQNPLGTSNTQTICSAGCAMSSVAEMLKHWNVLIDPGQLNQWLINHNGYADTDLLIWDTVDSFGPTFIADENPTVQELIDGINQCHGLIANVMNGEHWVLITGYAGNNNFYVNDPGFDNAYYPYDQMVSVIVYH